MCIIKVPVYYHKPDKGYERYKTFLHINMNELNCFTFHQMATLL